MINVTNTSKVAIPSAPSPQPKTVKETPSVEPAPKDTFAGTASTYVVAKGDTLGKIAKKTGIPYETLLQLNPHLTETQRGGLKRTGKGDLIYTGETINLRPVPKDYENLKDTVAAANEELKKKEAEQTLMVAKHTITDMSKPQAWRSMDEAKQNLAKADEALAKIPATDADQPKLQQAVKDLHTGFESIVAKLEDVAAGKKKTTKQTDEYGHEADVEVPRELDDETLDLGAEHFALANAGQKANLIKNLYVGYTTDKEQGRILDILRDAKRQGQLEETLDALSTMKSGLFSQNVLYNMPSSMDGKHLDELEEIVKGTKHEKLTKAIADSKERRANNNTYSG